MWLWETELIRRQDMERLGIGHQRLHMSDQECSSTECAGQAAMMVANLPRAPSLCGVGRLVL